MEGYHVSVLLKEAVEALNVAKDKWYLDATLGDGGHTVEVLRYGGKVVGVDVDPEALQRTEQRLEEAGYSEKNFKLYQGNFREVKNLIMQTESRDQKFHGILFDLGVSSLQLESPERGFSFGKDGPLDMRMDPNLGITALDFVNRLSGKELYELFISLGEEKYSRRLADALVLAREVNQFHSTKQLADFIERAVGGRKQRIHPATRVFQALRIAVNDELVALKEGLEQGKELLSKDGRIVVISFHSLEDRIVKNTFKQWEEQGEGMVLTGKPIIPTIAEVQLNSRSRSAKMRVFEKI